MKISLQLKLIIAFVLVAIITGLVLALVFRNVNRDRFDQFVLDQQSQTALATLAEYYRVNQSWDGIDQLLTTPRAIGPGVGAGMGMGPGGPNRGGQSAEARRLFGLADPDGLVIVGIENHWDLGSQLSSTDLDTALPIKIDDATVGLLLTVRHLPAYNAAERLFVERTNRALLLALIGAIVIAALIGVWIARGLTRPLRALTTATQKLAQGQTRPDVIINSRDELGELGEAFNKMSREIEQSNQLRRQMTADVAHDLRTPLTVIGGYVDAIREGTLRATPERMDLISEEVERLKQMVVELRLLSQADAGELTLDLQTLDPADLLARAAALFAVEAHNKSIDLVVSAQPGAACVIGDESRLMQVLDNLIVNALRHTPSGGKVTLALSCQENQALLSIQDTGEGIPAEELPFIFERFHRGDKSRHSEKNQSGLGLAIVKAIVTAHKGSVSATSTPGSGTTITLSLPTVG